MLAQFGWKLLKGQSGPVIKLTSNNVLVLFLSMHCRGSTVATLIVHSMFVIGHSQPLLCLTNCETIPPCAVRSAGYSDDLVYRAALLLAAFPKRHRLYSMPKTLV